VTIVTTSRCRPSIISVVAAGINGWWTGINQQTQKSGIFNRWFVDAVDNT